MFGESPIMNKVMLDTVWSYNLFHSIGLFSVFDNDIIRKCGHLYRGLQFRTWWSSEQCDGHHHPRWQQDPLER